VNRYILLGFQFQVLKLRVMSTAVLLSVVTATADIRNILNRLD